MVLALMLGTVFSLVLVFLARTRPPAGERRIYAVGLVVASLLYLVFGVIGGASGSWLGLEGLGVVIYGAAAWAGIRGRTWFLAAGWAFHVAWDVALHLTGEGAVYTPSWYPWLCVSFDLVMASAVLASVKRETFHRGTPT